MGGTAGEVGQEKKTWPGTDQHSKGESKSRPLGAIGQYRASYYASPLKRRHLARLIKQKKGRRSSRLNLSNFDPLNAADGSQDADSDEFTNLQEFRAGIDPHDTNTVILGIFFRQHLCRAALSIAHRPSATIP